MNTNHLNAVPSPTPPTGFKNSVLIANGKGGAGKTMVATNFAASEALENPDRRVIYVDLDPQGCGTTRLSGGSVDDHGKSLSESLVLGVMEIETDSTPILRPTKLSNLFYIAGGKRLAEVEQYAYTKIASSSDKKLHEVLATALISALSPFDDGNTSFFIDTPPTAGAGLPDAALMVSEWLVIPSQPKTDDIRGIRPLFERIVELDPPIKIAGLIFTRLTPSHTKINRAKHDEVFELYGSLFPVFESFIRTADKTVEDARELGIPEVLFADLADTLEASVSDAISGNGKRFAGNRHVLSAELDKAYAELCQMVELAENEQAAS